MIFWGWDILGSLIVVGPFIYLHKLCKALNLAAADFNAKNNMNQNYGGPQQAYAPQNGPVNQ